MTHSTRKVPVGGANELHRRVHTAEGIYRAAQACGAASVFGHLHTGIYQDFPHGLCTPTRGLKIVNDLRCSWNAECVYSHSFALEHTRKLEKVAGLPAGAGADVGAVQL